MSFFPTFNGGVLQPAQVSYTAITLSANLTLNWPDLDSTGTFTANIIEVTPTAGSLVITMPDATQRSVGQACLFRNMTGTAFIVHDNAGGTIANVPANLAIYIYLTINTTAAGSWSLVTFGAGTSSADSATLAGAGLKAIGITLNQKHDVLETSANVTIDSTSRAKAFVWTTGTLSCNLPTATSVGSDFFFIAKNGGSGSITVTPSGIDTIDGAASLVLAPNDACLIYSAGAANHWYSVGFGHQVSFAFTQLVKNVAGGTDVTLTSSECSNKVMTFTGLLTANINVIVTNTVSVYYVLNNTSGAFTLTIKTAAGTGAAIQQGTHDIVVCDATNVARAVTNTAATTAFAAGSVASPSITFVGNTNTGVYSPTTNQVGISAGATNSAIFTNIGVQIQGATGNRGAALEVLHNSLYNAEASGIYLESGTGTVGVAALYMFADQTNSLAGINSLVPGTGPLPLSVNAGGGQVRVGTVSGAAGGVAQTAAIIAARNAGASIEFGHNNTAGYGSVLGAQSSLGNPFLALCAVNGTNINTYKTLGNKGNVITTDLAGTLLFHQIANANLDNQSPTTMGQMTPSLWAPGNDLGTDLGGTGSRWAHVFTTVVDSGTAASLALRTNNGTVGFRIDDTAAGVNFWSALSGATGNSAVLRATGSDPNPVGRFDTIGTGGFTYVTNVAGSGATQFQILHTASATRNITITGSNGGNPTISATGGNVAFAVSAVPSADNGFNLGSPTLRWNTLAVVNIDSMTTGSLGLRTNNGTIGFQVLDTTGGTRNITVASSNGGNPTIGVTAGKLAITPSVVIAGTSVQFGTTPAPLSAVNGLGMPFGSFLVSNNSGGSADVLMAGMTTINLVNNVALYGVGSPLGATNSAGVLLMARSGAGAPGTADVPSSTWALWRDTAGATTKLYYNNAGTLQSVTLT